MKALDLAPLAGWHAGCSVTPTDVPVPKGEATIYVVDRGLPINTNGLFAGQVMQQVARIAAMQSR